MTATAGSSRSSKRLAVARFWYEGNAFSPISCEAVDFERREWLEGREALDAARGTATELGAVADFADSHPEWEVVTLRCASALPAGPIDDAVFDRLQAEILRGLSKGPWQAVYLSLHGAAITRRREAPELELLEAVRRLLPDVPVGASFDMHANLGTRCGPLLDMAAGYRTYPHVDMRDTAERVLRGLVRMVDEGLRTRVEVHKPGLLLASFNMATNAGPMRELQQLAASLAGGALIDASVFGGFPYADTTDTGASVLVVSERSDQGNGLAQAASARLLQALRQQAPRFAAALPTPEVGLAQALALLEQGAALVAVTDPGDNPLSGGACDTPGLFRALLATPFDAGAVFASFADPAAVGLAHELGVGGSGEFSLGARHGSTFGAAVELAAAVELLTDGVFTNRGPMETGMITRSGRTAMLRLRDRPNIRVIITEAVAPANDPAFFDLHRVALRPVDAEGSVRLLCVKAKNHFRGAFESLCTAIIPVDAPGPAALDLALLPFRRAGKRPS
jgi:microcystin degradation protein MlrC